MILLGKCCLGGEKRSVISSTKSLWELDEDGNPKDYVMEMKNQTMPGLRCHKEKTSQKEMKCQLECFAKDGALPQTDLMWRYVWGYAENKMRKVITNNEGRSITRKIDHEGQRKEAIKKEWEKGVKFTGKHQNN